jgi:hypothetical protein
MTTHAELKNNIALKFISGAVFTVLDLSFYNWRWVRPWELIEVEFSKGKCLFEVRKLEMDEEKLIAVVSPVEVKT